MNRSLHGVACLFLTLLFFSFVAQLATAALPPLAAGTFPIGTIVVPMDNKQADRIRVYGLIHEFLASRNDAEVARIIEPPDVTIQTALTPTGSIYQGGPFLIDQKFLPTVNSLLSSRFSGVTVTRLTTPFTSNQIFFVRQPTKILVIQGVFARTDLTLKEMGINFTLVTQSAVENNPSILRQYSLIVVDCPGWYGNPTTYTAERRVKIQNVYDTLSSHIRAGNEVIFTDIALRDLNGVFPGYVNTGLGAAGSWNTKVYNPPKPAGQFVAEFPSQYYNAGPNPNDIKIATEGGGAVVTSINPAHASDVRILMDSDKFGVPFRYAILGFYFQFGNGIVEGIAFHPQDQLPVGSPSFYATEQIYGNKFIHGPQIDFTVSLNPTTQTVSQGQTANFTVTVTSIGGVSAPVTLTVSGNPSNSVSSITPTTVTPPQGGSATSILRVATNLNTPNGTFTLTVTGTSTLPAITRFTTGTLTVLLSRPDFVLDANPKLLILNQTSCGNYTASIHAIGTFNSPVNLTLTGLPDGVSVNYYQRVVTPPLGGTVVSQVQVCAAGGAQPGNYTLVLTGSANPSGTPIVHTVTLSLRILQPSLNWLVYLLILALLLLAIGLALLFYYLSRKKGRPVLVPIRSVRPKPRVQYVLPLPTVRCRYCGRIMPLHAVYCPHCGRPQVVLTRPPPRMVSPGKLSGRGVFGVVLSLIAGILVLLNSAVLLVPSFYSLWSGTFFWLPTIGPSYAFALGVIIGLVLVMASIIMALRSGPVADIIIFPFAVFSLIIGGGFIAGFLLGVVGGIIGAIRR